MDNIMYIYNFLKTDKKKERFDIILEPLQSITQLALMAFCPCGSKLTISNNLLFIQCATSISYTHLTLPTKRIV